MQHVFHETVKALEAGDPCVMVTVIQTEGSTPQKPGAKLLVRADGSGVGTLGGGCVEGDIWFAAKMLLRGGGPAEVRDYELTEEIAARDGLICGGTMHFLLDPIREPIDVLPQLQQVERAYDGDTAIGIATLVGAPKGAPLAVGVKLYLDATGATRARLATLGSTRKPSTTSGNCSPTASANITPRMKASNSSLRHSRRRQRWW